MSKPVIAVVAAGDMGAGVGARLVEQGARVLTSLDGRGADSRARAEAAGMLDASDAELAGADMILSIVPPARALALAERLTPSIEKAERKPLYVDCNAIAPETVRKVAAVIEPSGAPFADAGIIGNPPKGDYTPAIYASGEHAAAFAELNAFGLDIRVMDGPVGQASALKMCYAGLTKGLHAVGVSVMLGAVEAGVAGPFLAELEDSQPMLLDYFRTRTPGIFPKAYRWVKEMQEIGAFLGDGGETIYWGAAEQFARLAADHGGPKVDETALRALLKKAD